MSSRSGEVAVPDSQDEGNSGIVRLNGHFPHPFHLPLDESQYAVESHAENPKSLAELRMISLSWAIRSKKGWQEKLKNEEIVKRWKEEAVSQQKNLLKEQKLSANMINYVFAELEAYARLTDSETGTQHGCNDFTFCSYNLVPEDMTERLRSGVAILEDVPDEDKDWHPGSNEQVLDLVHPSMYCLVYGFTLIRESENKIKVAETPSDDDVFTSCQFAWIPSDFAVSKEGEVSLVSSYINNLHKEHKTLYEVIPKILGRFVPMFERLLGAIDITGRPRTRRGGDDPETDENEKGIRILWDAYGDVPCLWKGHGEPWDNKLYESSYVGFDGETRRERQVSWLRTQDMILPEAPETYSGELEQNFRIISLRGKTIQCIVKLANIHLTPEKPEYVGGSWHIEGMLNEHIIATGIYYYDSENVTDSQLSFRVPVHEPTYHFQDDSFCMQTLFGIDRDEPLIQDRGSVTTIPGLALAFPNLYQHRVSPFRLADATKPGHRKILAFFLIDPNEKVPSATNIMPQQGEWLFHFLSDAGPEGIRGTYLERLPVELRTMIAEQTDGVMNWALAAEHREALMAERSEFVTTYDDGIVGATFNLCEH